MGGERVARGIVFCHAMHGYLGASQAHDL